MRILPQEILNVKIFISCILVNFLHKLMVEMSLFMSRKTTFWHLVTIKNIMEFNCSRAFKHSVAIALKY